jgi:hypothetical protein
MRKPLIITAALAAIAAPIVAVAIGNYENDITFTYFGSAKVITRDAGFYDGIPKPFVELECEATDSVDAVHPLMTPDEARVLGEMLVAAGDAAEAQ